MGMKFSQVTRPSYLPFMGIVKKEIKVPLHLIVDVIIEQGTWLCSSYFDFNYSQLHVYVYQYDNL